MTTRPASSRAAGGESAAARRIWWRRSRSLSGLLLAFCGTVLVFAFLLSFVLGFSSRREASDVTAALTTGSIDTRSESITAPLAANASQQDATVRRTLASTFGAARVTVATSTISSPWPVTAADGKKTSGAPTAMFLASSPALLRSISSSPGASGGSPRLATVSIDAAGARALHLGPGDDIVVHLDRGSTTLRVSSTWTARAADDGLWSGLGPQAQGASARLLLSSAAMSKLGIERYGHWAIAPAASTTPGQLQDLDRGFEHMASTVGAAAPGGSSLSVSGGGQATVAGIIQAIAAARAVLPAPVAILGIAAAVALVLVVQLIAAVRENEMRMLRARGARVGTIARASVWEAGTLSLGAALAGTLLAQLVLLAVAGAPVNPVEPVLAPLIAFAVATIILAGSAIWSAVSASGGPRADSGRGRAAISGSAAAVALVAAGLSTWRLLAYGTASPTSHPDPLGGLAPALVLLAFAILCLVAIGPAALFVSSRIPSSRGAAATLSARQVARSVALFAGPAALIALAAGGLSLASGYTATLQGLQYGSAHVGNGADLRAVFPDRVVVGSAEDLLALAPYRRAAGLVDVTPVVQTSNQVGDSTVSVLAVDRSRLGALVSVDPAIVDASRISDELTTSRNPLPGIAVPATSSTLTADLTVGATSPAPGSTATVTLWLVNPSGQIVPVTLGAAPVQPLATETRQTRSVATPAGGPWTVVAGDIDIDAHTAMTGLTVRLDLNAGKSVDGLAWKTVPAVFGSAFTALHETDGSIAVSRATVPRSSNGDSIVRVMPGRASDVPVVVNSALATALGATLGSTATFQGTWSTFRGVVAGIVPVVPGAPQGPAAISDIAAYDAAALRNSVQVPAVNQVWANDTGAPGSASRLATIAGADATVTTTAAVQSDRFIGSSLVALWLGAGGAAAFSIIALAGAVAALGRRRSDEVAVLRAIGFSARQQSQGRLAEYAGVVVYATVVGAVGGIVTVLLFAAPLSLISVPDTPAGIPVPIHVAVALLAPAGALLLVLAALVVSIAANRVQASAADATLRGQV